MSEDLKACPFCGGKAKIGHATDEEGWIVGYFIECPSIKCHNVHQMRFSHKEQDAIKVWNTRPVLSPVKWPAKQYSYATMNGQEYTTEFQDGWNNAIDACIAAASNTVGVEWEKEFDKLFVNVGGTEYWKQ